MASRTVVGRAFSSNDDCSYHSALVAKYGIATAVGCLEQLQGGGWLGQLRYAGNFWRGSRASVGLHSQPPACKGRTRASTTESGVPRQLKNGHLKYLAVICSTEQGSCLLASNLCRIFHTKLDSPFFMASTRLISPQFSLLRSTLGSH